MSGIVNSSVRLKVGIKLPTTLDVENYLKDKTNFFAQLFLLILETMGLSFDVVAFDTGGVRLKNGSWTGLLGRMNRTEIDTVAYFLLKTEERAEAVHFAYPFALQATAFLVKKYEQFPRIFRLFLTFSVSVWVTFAIFMILMVFVKFLVMRRRYSLPEVLLHVFAVSLQQQSLLKPSNTREKLLIYSWIIGTMLLSSSYVSVFFSCLTLPRMTAIQNVRELAKAVEKGDYRCVMLEEFQNAPKLFLKTDLKQLRVIGNSILQSPNGFVSFDYFFHLKKEKVALFSLAEAIPYVSEDYFVSDDHVLEIVTSMVVRKDFCCKKQLDMVMHRLMAGGFYDKITKDSAFLSRLKYQFMYSKERRLEKLTLSDVSAAFLFLLCGYCISFLVLIAEKLSLCKKKRKVNFRKLKERINKMNKL